MSLTPAQRTILADVLREGEDFREEVESAVLRYGRSLLDKVFGGDTSAALAGNFGWAPPPLGRKEPTGSPSRLKGPWGDFWGRRYIG